MDKTKVLAAFSKPRTKRVTVAGAEYSIRAFSLHEHDEYMDMMISRNVDGAVKSLSGLRAWLVVHGVADDAGARLFDDVDLATIEAGDSEIMIPLAEAIGQYNGVFGGAEDAEKN